MANRVLWAMLIDFQPADVPYRFNIRGAFDLERCVAALFYAAGSQVILGGGWRPDGGVDVLALHGGKSTAVQCKYWQNRVGVRSLRELVGAQVDFRASDSAFVATSGFTDGAKLYARRNGVQLIGEEALQQALGTYGLTPDFREAFEYFARQCPKCSGELVHRTNGDTGQPFWGCRNYSRTGCSFTEPYDRRVLEPRPAAKAS